MIEHWYDYLPAAWFTPEGAISVTASLLLLMLLAFVLGVWVGKRTR